MRIVFDFLKSWRREPKPLTRMSHPIWQFYFEELRREGKSSDDKSVMEQITLSFVVAHIESTEAMCRDGYSKYGRGAIVHTPLVVGGKPSAYRNFPSSQYYLGRARIEELRPLSGSGTVDGLAHVMDTYNPDREYISAVWMTFDNEKRTSLDFIGWLTVPYLLLEDRD